MIPKSDRRRIVIRRAKESPIRPCAAAIPRQWEAIRKGTRATIEALLDGKSRWPLFLWGLSGTGKTCAALATADVVDVQAAIRYPDGEIVSVQTLQAVWYGTVERLVRMTLADEGWKEFATAALAVVDELSTRSKPTDLEYVSVKRAADLREYSPTIWISNHGPEKIREHYDDRIYSRVCCGTVVELREQKDRRFA